MVVMLSAYLKPAVTRAINPIARGALRIGLTPNAVTATGALGLVSSALYFYPRQEFFVGTLVISFSHLVIFLMEQWRAYPRAGPVNGVDF
jgi:CDP-diacylglycerol---glycerol-3-phosphate 3-phosphatidyltransferase